MSERKPSIYDFDVINSEMDRIRKEEEQAKKPVENPPTTQSNLYDEYPLCGLFMEYFKKLDEQEKFGMVEDNIEYYCREIGKSKYGENNWNKLTTDNVIVSPIIDRILP